MSCQSLNPFRQDFSISLNLFYERYPALAPLVKDCLSFSPVHFYLDCSTLPLIITARQEQGGEILHPLFKLTLIFCFLVDTAQRARSTLQLGLSVCLFVCLSVHNDSMSPYLSLSNSDKSFNSLVSLLQFCHSIGHNF